MTAPNPSRIARLSSPEVAQTSTMRTGIPENVSRSHTASSTSTSSSISTSATATVITVQAPSTARLGRWNPSIDEYYTPGPIGRRKATGTCQIDHTVPPAFIDSAAYDGGDSGDPLFYHTTSNLSIAGQTYRIPAPPVWVDEWHGYDDYSPGYSKPRFWLDDTGQRINSTWLRSIAVCQADKSYQWGFSAVALFAFLVLTSLFGAVLLLLSEAFSSQGRRNCAPAYISVYRDILDVAEEITNELGDGAKDLSARELDTIITSLTGQVRIEEDVPLACGRGNHQKVSSTFSDTGTVSQFRQFFTSRQARTQSSPGKSRVGNKALLSVSDVESLDDTQSSTLVGDQALNS